MNHNFELNVSKDDLCVAAAPAWLRRHLSADWASLGALGGPGLAGAVPYRAGGFMINPPPQKWDCCRGGQAS